MVGRGAEAPYGGGSALLPLPAAILLRLVGVVPRDGEHPQQRSGLGIHYRGVGVVHALMVPSADRHLHIRLAAADPDLPYQDVVQTEFVAVADGDAVGAAGIGCGYLDDPAAFPVRAGAVVAPVPGSFYPDGGGPVGIDTLAAALSEERDTLEEVLEPFLMKLGFLFIKSYCILKFSKYNKKVTKEMGA